METWQRILQNSITTLDGLKGQLDCDHNALGQVIANFPMRINPYFANLNSVGTTLLFAENFMSALKLLNEKVLFKNIINIMLSKFYKSDETH